jgi:hypothetical protein
MDSKETNIITSSKLMPSEIREVIYKETMLCNRHNFKPQKSSENIF